MFRSTLLRLLIREMSSDSAVYPWSLESIYPPVSADGYSRVVKPHSSVYPFVQPYSGVSGSAHIPGILDGDECKSTNVVSLRSPSEVIIVSPSVSMWLRKFAVQTYQSGVCSISAL